MACINAVSFHENRSIEDICHLIQRTGFESIEISRIPFFEKLTTTNTRKVFANWIEELGLSMHGFDAWVNFDPYHAKEETIEGFKRAIDFASDLNLGQIITHDGQIDITKGKNPGECLDILIPLFQQIADLSDQNGLNVVLEPHPDTLSMDDTFAIDLIDGIDRRNIGLVYDCCHYGVGQPNTYIQAIKNLAHRIQHIHFSDGDCRTYALHLPLEEGELKLDAIIENLQEIGFNGTLTSDMYNYPLLEDGAKRNLEKIKAVEEKLGL